VQTVPPPPYALNHAWTAVCIDDDEWHLIDSCWGAGVVHGANKPFEKKFNPTMFTQTNEEFGKRHFPADPAYQLVSDPLTWEDYINEPEGPQAFQALYALQYDPYTLWPPTKTIEPGVHEFHVWKLCLHLVHPRQEYVLLLHTPDGEYTPLEEDCEVGGWKAIYDVATPGDVSVYFLKEIGGKDAKGVGVDGFRRAWKRQAMSWEGCCRWTVQS